jgi:cell division protein YceG involved in septum cleavage
MMSQIKNLSLSISLKKYQSMTTSFYFGLLVCVFSLLCSFILLYIDNLYSSEKEEAGKENQVAIAPKQSVQKIFRKFSRAIRQFDSVKSINHF